MLSKITNWFETSRTGVTTYLFLDKLMQYAWGLGVLFRDTSRFIWWSSAFRQNYSEFSIEAKMIAISHRIEKAYSFLETRPGFGKNTIYELIDLIKLYEKRGYSKDKLGYRMSIRALKFYLEKHKEQGVFLDTIENEISRLSSSSKLEDILRPIQSHPKTSGFAELAKNRASIRNFSNKPVDYFLIAQAIDMARYTPSVCNRQPWHVHAYHDNNIKQKLLNLQGGNRGFGHTADWVLVITSNLGSFINVKERFEVYIDGGLFSMSLIYAFQDIGLGTCALNWCAKPSKDKKIRRLIKIAEEEEIIMLIAIGHFNENVQAAYSEKRSVNEIITNHNKP